MSDQIELHEYESAPYRRALQAGYLALRHLETEMGGAPALPQDAAEIAVSAAIRRLVADGQLPALGTRKDPARVYAPGSQAHRYAPPVAPVLDRPRAAFTTQTAADVESVKRVADQQAAMAFAATPAEDDPRIDPARYPTFSHDDRPR